MVVLTEQLIHNVTKTVNAHVSQASLGSNVTNLVGVLMEQLIHNVTKTVNVHVNQVSLDTNVTNVKTVCFLEMDLMF